MKSNQTIFSFFVNKNNFKTNIYDYKTIFNQQPIYVRHKIYIQSLVIIISILRLHDTYIVT